VHDLAAHPKDLVLTATLVLQTENLADDLYDLSQIAYDNDKEELGNHLTDLQTSMDHNKDALANYLLSLAEEVQNRVEELEKDKADLEQKLKEAKTAAKPNP
jgi:tryptophanyl-tRNA synthetase